jgi:hypothetical protein
MMENHIKMRALEARGVFLPTLISGGQSCGRSQSTSERDCNGMIPALFRSICLNTWPSSFGLAGAIVAWEMLPADSRLVHPMILLCTDNMTAKAWTKKISGIKTPQGHSLARIFAHLLMFSDVEVKAKHIEGEKNIIADFLSRLYKTHKSSAFTYDMLQTQFPWLKLSHRFTPSKELHALVYSALSQPSVMLPTTRVKLGQMIVEPSTLKQPFFGP